MKRETKLKGRIREKRRSKKISIVLILHRKISRISRKRFLEMEEVKN